MQSFGQGINKYKFKNNKRKLLSKTTILINKFGLGNDTVVPIISIGHSALNNKKNNYDIYTFTTDMILRQQLITLT